MRIVGGVYSGFKLQAPKTPDTRPITDQAKEALFNMLGDISDLSFLDVYAGSGSVGLEAVSRGAYPVALVDSAAAAIDAIEVNVRHLNVSERVTVERKPVALILSGGDETYDIVFADPPFEEIDEVPLPQLAALARRLFIYKHQRRHRPVDIEGMERVRSRRYGDSVISIYRRSSPDEA